MTKFEFLGDLSRLIADLPQEEVEQAMEYYEDYFADAGPEKEQEIIKDFISPAYIAEQLREASLERQRLAANSSMQEEERLANAAMAAAAAGKPAVFSRKHAAAAQKKAAGVVSSQPQAPTQAQAQAQTQPQVQPQMQAQTQPQPQVQPQPQMQAQAQTQPQMQPQAQAQAQPQMQTQPQAQSQAQMQAQPQPQAAPQGITPQPGTVSQSTASPAPTNGTTAPIPDTPKEKKSSNMRNSIFRDDADDSEKAAAELERKNKTKVDIKSINATTSKVDKKQAKENAKRNAAEEKAYNAEMYSSSKKMVIGIVLLITCPIWLAILGVILGLFVLGAGAVVGAIVLGLISFCASVVSLFLSILSLLTVQIATFVFALGCVCFLFAAGVGLWFLSYKLATRVLPGGYFNARVLFTSVKARLNRLALK